MANASLFSFQEADAGGTLWVQTTWMELSNLGECGTLMAFCLRGEESQSLPLLPLVVETEVQDKQYKCGRLSLTQPFGFWEPILWTRRTQTSLSLQRCFLEWKTGNHANIQGQGNTLWSVHTVGDCAASEGKNEKVLCVLIQDDLQDRLRGTANVQHVISHYIPFLPLSYLSSFIYSTKCKVWNTSLILAPSRKGRQISKNLRPAWLMYQVPGQLEIYNETLFQKKKNPTFKKKKKTIKQMKIPLSRTGACLLHLFRLPVCDFPSLVPVKFSGDPGL